ncbi:MAG TPA: methylated-DNA--[protein]-cysteine S-methyltransferase [Caulobacteraceae bacterium]|jgi:methylated-DNA-[protein]-cysteine S-methyltransferase|nr:methylated-DNA--[protein]-cysteine S-methyltransferase [Caulobacteraceae bacterium]
MSGLGFALFDTAIGPCAIAWGERGVIGVHFPEPAPEQTRARLARRFPDAEELAPPPAIARAIERITALLAGEAIDLTGVELDMDSVSEFQRRVYETARTIPPGRTATYGEIAERLGDKALAREVGQALGKNPFPIIVPCHRVLAAGGKTGGFSARGGVDAKLRLLTIEKARTDDAPLLFDDLPLARG